MEYSGARGKLIHEKNQKQKISWHCPFKGTVRQIRSWVLSMEQVMGVLLPENLRAHLQLSV